MAAKIVISHAAVETELAHALKNLICDTIPELRRTDVWFSSERSGSFDPRDPFFNQIVQRFHECSVVVSIQSPVSQNRPWPLWESGFAYGLHKGPVVFTFSAAGSITGRLESPLNVLTHYDGTDAERLRDALNQIAILLPSIFDSSTFPHRFTKFITETKEEVLKCKNASLSFDRRLTLVLTMDEYKEIHRVGIIPSTALLIGDDLTLNVFGFPPRSGRTICWKDFTTHLDTIDTPWPNSSVRWAKNLAGVLKMADGDRLISESEAMPLYYSNTLLKSLRPALTKRVDRGDSVEFEIAFIDIPKELTVRPSGDLGILFHYLDFCRMMRWGVLESGDILDLRTRPNLERDLVRARIRELLAKISNIRTEFWNRGIPKDALLQVVDRPQAARIIEMLKNYYSIIEPLDPDDEGDGPTLIPSREEFLSQIDRLAQSNKEFFMLVSSALNDNIQKL